MMVIGFLVNYAIGLTLRQMMFGNVTVSVFLWGFFGLAVSVIVVSVQSGRLTRLLAEIGCLALPRLSRRVREQLKEYGDYDAP